ncbi:MAG TPA: hypothetical protein VEL76_18620, partial [Gemmataceae bacterium]|nr:hypothetical protein [Gemmataceae bacterium]
MPAALQPVPQLGPDLATNPQRLPPPQRGARRADWLLCALLRGGRADPADALQTLYPCCAGRAVHPQNGGGVRRSVGVEVHHEVRTFLTRRRVLADGLAEQGVPLGPGKRPGAPARSWATWWRAAPRPPASLEKVTLEPQEAASTIIVRA